MVCLIKTVLTHTILYAGKSKGNSGSEDYHNSIIDLTDLSATPISPALNIVAALSLIKEILNF